MRTSTMSQNRCLLLMAATVKLPREQMALLKAMAERTKSDPTVDPLTGAELGCGEPKEDK